jgi:hypothetical protein
LLKVIDAARKKGIPLVAPCVSRLVRSENYHAHKFPEEKPTVAQFGKLLELTQGVPVATLNDPDADPPADEAFLRQLVAEVKHTKVGRKRKQLPGYRKARKADLKDRAMEMQGEGLFYRQIADQLYDDHGVKVSHVAVQTWCLEEDGNPC